MYIDLKASSSRWLAFEVMILVSFVFGFIGTLVLFPLFTWLMEPLWREGSTAWCYPLCLQRAPMLERKDAFASSSPVCIPFSSLYSTFHFLSFILSFPLACVSLLEWDCRLKRENPVLFRHTLQVQKLKKFQFNVLISVTFTMI